MFPTIPRCSHKRLRLVVRFAEKWLDLAQYIVGNTYLHTIWLDLRSNERSKKESRWKGLRFCGWQRTFEKVEESQAGRTMMYVRSAAFMVIKEEPRATDIWVGMKDDLGAKARADPQMAARSKARKDFILFSCSDLDSFMPTIVLMSQQPHQPNRKIHSNYVSPQSWYRRAPNKQILVKVVIYGCSWPHILRALLAGRIASGSKPILRPRQTTPPRSGLFPRALPRGYCSLKYCLQRKCIQDGRRSSILR